MSEKVAGSIRQAMRDHRVTYLLVSQDDFAPPLAYCRSCGYLGEELGTWEHQANIAAEALDNARFGDLENAWDRSIQILKSYAEDQSMAGAYFPEWETTARMIGAAPDLNPYRKEKP